MAKEKQEESIEKQLWKAADKLRKNIEAVEFLLSPEEKLKVFSDYADNAWNKIDGNHIQIKTLENMRDTLVPKLLSGEVRVEG